MRPFVERLDPSLVHFTVNTVLVIVDAAVGYFCVPLARTALGITEPEDGGGENRLRRLLTGVVAFYMLLNCIGYFRQMGWLLVAVSIFVTFDIIAELYVRRKIRQRKG